jgi:hypothetical protein
MTLLIKVLTGVAAGAVLATSAFAYGATPCAKEIHGPSPENCFTLFGIMLYRTHMNEPMRLVHCGSSRP